MNYRKKGKGNTERRNTNAVNFAGLVEETENQSCDNSDTSNDETGGSCVQSKTSETPVADQRQQKEQQETIMADQQQEELPQQQPKQQSESFLQTPKTTNTRRLSEPSPLSPIISPRSRADGSGHGRSINRPETEKPLLDEIREVLAQSYLSFLLADLRHLSGTGQIMTKYENLAIDSDVCERWTSDQIAGLCEGNGIGKRPGLSPVVIMALLILEIRDTYVMTAEERKRMKPKQGESKRNLYATSVDIDTDVHFVAYENNKTKKKLTEESMESLMRCYSRMVSEDLVTEIPNVRRRRTTMNLDSNRGEGGLPQFLQNTGRKIRFPRRSMQSGSASSGDGASSGSFSSSISGAFSTIPRPRRGTRGSSSPLPRQSSNPLGSLQEETDSDLGFEVRQVGSKDSVSSSYEKGNDNRVAISKEDSCSTINNRDSNSTISYSMKDSVVPISPIAEHEEDKDGEYSAKYSELSDTLVGENDEHFDDSTKQPSSLRSAISDQSGRPTNRSGAVTFRLNHENEEHREDSRSSMQQFFSPRRRRQTIGHGPGDSPHHHMSLRDTMAISRQKSQHFVDKLKTDFNDQVENLLPTNREGNTGKEFQELTNAFFDQGQTNEDVRTSLGVTYTRKELVGVLRHAVETRDDESLQFLSKFFKDGTVSRLLVESHSRVVWMNDWYPLKELTYSITVDALQRRVMVVFRGAITPEDWKSAVNFKFHNIRNPVKEEFDGKKDVLRVFSGLYTYLFRKRKDTGTTKYDEIANMCHKYGLHHIGPDYKLFVTGHSLGGALTHFFSFFASTEERFTKNGPVKAIAFASPYIGGHSWADAIRHQEKSKKLQLVQCRNDSDVIPRLPANFRIGKRGPLWRHVGIGVTLPRLPKKMMCRFRWKPMVHYWGKEKSCLSSTVHACRRNVIFHFSYLRPWTLNRSHTLFELQDRLMYGELNSKKSGDFDLLQNTLDELYEKLYEHDFQTFRKNSWWGKKTGIH